MGRGMKLSEFAQKHDYQIYICLEDDYWTARMTSNETVPLNDCEFYTVDAKVDTSGYGKDPLEAYYNLSYTLSGREVKNCDGDYRQVLPIFEEE